MNKIHRDLTTMVDGDDGARDETDMKVMIVTIKMRVLRMVMMAMMTTMMMTMLMTTTMMMMMMMMMMRRW